MKAEVLAQKGIYALLENPMKRIERNVTTLIDLRLAEDNPESNEKN